MLKSQKEDKPISIFKDIIISRKQMSASREKLVKKKNLIKENKGIFQINRGIMKRYVDQEEVFFFFFFLIYKANRKIGETWIWTTY